MQEILILVVEDDPLIQMEIEDALHSGGYLTVAEVNDEAAIAKLETEPNVRALLTDINLALEVSGWDAGNVDNRKVREQFARPACHVAADEWTSQGVPKSLLIQKPFASAQVITAVSQLLNAVDAPPSIK